MPRVYDWRHRLVTWAQSNKMVHVIATNSFVLGKEYDNRKKERYARLHLIGGSQIAEMIQPLRYIFLITTHIHILSVYSSVVS